MYIYIYVYDSLCIPTAGLVVSTGDKTMLPL